MKRNSSFALRLTFPIVLCTIAIFAATILVVASAVNTILSHQAIEKSSSALETASLYVNTSLEEVQTVIENNIWLVTENMNDTSAFSQITAKVLRDNQGIIGSAIALNPYMYGGMKCSGYSCYDQISGRIVYSSLYTSSYDYTTMDWYQIPLLLGNPVWSEPYFDEGGGNQYMTTYSYPVRDINGNIFAIFTADIPMSWLTDKAKTVKPYEESINLVVSRGGKFLTGDSSFVSGETIFSYALERSDTMLLKAAKRMVSGVTDNIEFELGDDDVIGLYGPLENGWSIMVASYYSDVFRPSYIINLILIVMLIIAVIVIVIISHKIINKYTSPLSEFATIVTNIGDGNLENSFPEINSNDEIKTLRDAIETMQKSIKENKQHKEDTESAEKIQQTMLPPFSYISDRFDINASLRSARGVGGDMFDYYKSEQKNKLFFVVGDVSGKGMPAALFMSMVISQLRVMTKYSNLASEIVTKVNDSIASNNPTTTFVTLIYGSIEINTGKLTICNAGHEKPILVDPSGNARYLDIKPNLVGAVMEGFEYQSDEFDMEPGSTLVLYTDGVNEAERPDLSQYGEDRLLEFVSSLPLDMSSEEIVNAIREDVRAFAECRKYAEEGMEPSIGYPQNDDVTIMVIKFK